MENDEKIVILYKRVNKAVKTTRVDNTLESIEKLLKGHIESLSYMDNILLFYKVEGEKCNLKNNLIFHNDHGENYFIPDDFSIKGDCIIVGDDYRNATFRSLTEEELKKCIRDVDSRSVKYKENMNDLQELY